MSQASQRNEKADTKLAYLVQEINSLETQIHEYLRLTPTTLSVIFAASGVAIALGYSNSSTPMMRNIVLVIFPVMIGLLMVYHFNVASEVAGLAEQRDRLRAQANRALGGRKVFVGRLVSDVRRGSWGTWTLYALAVCILAGAIWLGFQNALHEGIWWIRAQTISTIITVIALAIATAEISITRIKVNKKLDKEFGTRDRPPTAPSSKDGWLKKFIWGFGTRHK
jgi:hypothetical protein